MPSPKDPRYQRGGFAIRRELERASIHQYSDFLGRLLRGGVRLFLVQVEILPRSI
jgi:hypothetical protein